MDLLKNLFGGKKEAAASDSGATAPRHLTRDEFDALVRAAEVPVVVDFWAEWCGPCHAIAPAVANLAAEFADRAIVAKLNADDYPDVLARYGIMGIPTLIYFKAGQEADRVIGFTSYGVLKSKLERLLS